MEAISSSVTFVKYQATRGNISDDKGRAIAQDVSLWLPTAARFRALSVHVGFVMDVPPKSRFTRELQSATSQKTAFLLLILFRCIFH
jgi:hypothetical protein